MNASYETASSSVEAAVVFANIKHLSQQHSTTTTSSITASTKAASQLPHVLHSRQSKITQPSYHRNQQYSIIGLTNAAGTLVERYSYSAYGTLGIYAANGTVRTSSTYANRYTYTGREYDPDLNLYRFRARWYDPSTGGFISRDPLGYVDGMSLYRGYFAVAELDPNGALRRSNFRAIRKGDPCDGGVIGIKWDWELEHTFRKGKTIHSGHQHGWIIQRIETRCIECECDNCYSCVNCKVSEPVVYYEAWYFGKFDKAREGPDSRVVDLVVNGGTDYHQSKGVFRKECFTRTMKAEARFLTTSFPHKDDSYDLIDGQPGWRKGMDPFFHSIDGCRVTYGNLHTYIGKDVPLAWERAGLKTFIKYEPPVTYEYAVSLNCCSPNSFGYIGQGDFPIDLDFYVDLDKVVERISR